MQPAVRPVLDCIGNHVPSWLRYPRKLMPAALQQKLSKEDSK
jgi:hypothetical protein